MQSRHVDVFLEEAQLILENEFSEKRATLLAEVYTDMINQFPDASVTPYVGMAYLAYKANLHNEACVFLRSALKIEPFNSTIQTLLKKIQNAQPADFSPQMIQF